MLLRTDRNNLMCFQLTPSAVWIWNSVAVIEGEREKERRGVGFERKNGRERGREKKDEKRKGI